MQIHHDTRLIDVGQLVVHGIAEEEQVVGEVEVGGEHRRDDGALFAQVLEQQMVVLLLILALEEGVGYAVGLLGDWQRLVGREERGVTTMVAIQVGVDQFARSLRGRTDRW